MTMLGEILSLKRDFWTNCILITVFLFPLCLIQDYSDITKHKYRILCKCEIITINIKKNTEITKLIIVRNNDCFQTGFLSLSLVE